MYKNIVQKDSGIENVEINNKSEIEKKASLVECSKTFEKTNCENNKDNQKSEKNESILISPKGSYGFVTQKTSLASGNTPTTVDNQTFFNKNGSEKKREFQLYGYNIVSFVVQDQQDKDFFTHKLKKHKFSILHLYVNPSFIFNSPNNVQNKISNSENGIDENEHKRINLEQNTEFMPTYK